MVTVLFTVKKPICLLYKVVTFRLFPFVSQLQVFSILGTKTGAFLPQVDRKASCQPFLKVGVSVQEQPGIPPDSVGGCPPESFFKISGKSKGILSIPREFLRGRILEKFFQFLRNSSADEF